MQKKGAEDAVLAGARGEHHVGGAGKGRGGKNRIVDGASELRVAGDRFRPRVVQLTELVAMLAPARAGGELEKEVNNLIAEVSKWSEH